MTGWAVDTGHRDAGGKPMQAPGSDGTPLAGGIPSVLGAADGACGRPGALLPRARSARRPHRLGTGFLSLPAATAGMWGFRRGALRSLPLLLCTFLAGCRGCTSTRPPIHINPNMDDQPKLKAQSESGFFYDGSGMRTPVEDTVALGELHEDTAYWTGKTADGAYVTSIPSHGDAAAVLLTRGEQRFGIYCNPCHGPAADGKGMLFQRAQVQSANLMEQRFRDMPVGQIFDEVTHGQGLMPAYGPFVPVADRWAILSYVRKLQAETPVAEAAQPAAAAAVTTTAPAAASAAPPAASTGGVP